MAIADASVLISLAKIERLRLLKRVFGDMIICPTVKGEVIDKGLEISAPDVAPIQQALDERWLGVARLTAAERDLKQRLIGATTLDEGEAESLAIAKLRNETLLVDEKQARAVARALGVELMGSAGVLLEAFRLGEITLAELEQSVKDLAGVMWLSPVIVADILRRAREANE